MADDIFVTAKHNQRTPRSNRKKWVGLSLMIFSAICFICCLFPSFLHIGFFFYGLLGVTCFWFFPFLFIVGLALLKKMTFSAGKKYAAYIIMSYICVILLLHLIFQTQMLSTYYLEFNHFKGYTSSTYLQTYGISVGGILFGIPVYFFRCLIGIVGSYILFIIMSAIFIGLLTDYIIYNRTIQKRKELYSEKAKNNYTKDLQESTKIIDKDKVDEYSFITSGDFDKQEQSQSSQEQVSSPIWNYNNDFFASSDEQTDEKIESQQNENEQETPEEDKFSQKSEAYRKLYGNLDDATTKNSDENKKKSAKELIYGTKPTLPDYFFTNPNAKSDAQNFVRNYNNPYSNNNLGNDSNDEVPSFPRYSEPTSTPTPNLDNNVLNNSSVRSSWNNFEPETIEEDKRPISSLYDNNQKSSKFGDFESNNQDVSLVKSESGFKSKGESNIFAPDSPKEKSQREERKVTKQTNIYDDAPKQYFRPPLSLLKTYADDKQDHTAEFQKKTAVLNQVFESFGIPARVSNVVRGPKFTRYEVSLQIGTSVNKVLQIEKNIEMALETDSGIRIEAPIPGKNAIGIEVKNDHFSTVGLRELLESPEYENSKYALPIAIGKNITGDIIVSGMEKMLHLLVAGSTGSGKSVFIHSLLVSLLYKCSPDDLKLVIIDPKQVDFVKYNGIPHLITPEVLFSFEQAVNALNWVVEEMEKRYTTFRQAGGYANIKEYNKSPMVSSGEAKKIPYIVVIVDEYADLTAYDKNGTLEILIKRITQKARAAGIHILISTQKPTVEVINGVIKTNLPTRVAFSLTNGTDSRVILDEVGAEKLLGAGDMLFAPQDSNKKIRLQGAWISDDEIRSIVSYIRSKNIASFDENLIATINKKLEEPKEEASIPKVSDNDENDSYEVKEDPLMKKCLELVIARGKATTTMLVTKLSIGYSRAARIIEQMAERGYISDTNGKNGREILITQEKFDQLFNNSDTEN